MKPLTVDEFLEKIGSFGRYQIALALLLNLCYAVWWCFPVLAVVFIASEPGWRCLNNETCPFTDTIRIGQENYKHRCHIPREDWEFVDDFTSVVTEFDLVCDRGSLGFVSTSVIFAGFFVGSLVVSPISDKFGRKHPVFVCGFLCSLIHFVSAFVPKFWLYALFRGVIGFMIGAYSIPIFVLATEFSGIRHRSTVGGLSFTLYFMFQMILAGIAYYVRNWKHLTLITGSPGLLFTACWFFTPESIRWLLKKGRVSEAKTILSKIARINGNEMPKDELMLSKEERLGDFRDLFSSGKMVHKTLGSWFIWFAVSFISWGVSFSAPFLGGNIYVNVTLTAVAALPAYPISAVLALRFSRRKILLASFLLSALSAIGALLVSDKAEHDKGYLAAKIILSTFGAKFFSNIGFSLVYIFSAEMFPTTVRSVGMGTSTASARVSAFASAYAPLLLVVHRFLPFGIMAGLAVAAAVVCMTLPETYNQPTIENLATDDTTDGNKADLVEDTAI